MAEEKRVRRTTEQMICAIDEDIAALRESIKVIEEKKAASAAAFDKKIETVETKIAKLNERKINLLNPKKRKPRKTKAQQMKELLRLAQKNGLKPAEIAELLGLELPKDE